EALYADGTIRTLIELTRATILNESGNYREAERIARAELEAAGSHAFAPLASFTLAAALVGQGRWGDAEKAMANVGSSPLLGSVGYELSVAGLRAQILAEKDVAAGRRQLADAVARADAIGQAAVAIDLQIRLGQVELDHGDASK